MKRIETNLNGCFLIDPKVFWDDRGLFYESFNKQSFRKISGIDIDFVQVNVSVSNKGVVRGLHMQSGEYAQAKLVQVIKGKVRDVVVDVRKNSETFGQIYSCILSEENKRQLFIPRGFLHGFLALEDDTIFTYKCDNYYHKNSELGVCFNDEDLDIDWGIHPDELIISEKDGALGSFKNLPVFE